MTSPTGDPYLRDAERAYDDLGRETSRTGGGQTISTTYYKDGSIDTTTGTDGRTWKFLYDPVGRTTSLTRQGTPASYATSYVYNNTGQLASETADGRQTSYTYATSNDAAAGRYKGLLQSQVDAVTGGTTAYTYDTAGRVATRVDPAGMTWTRTYETETGRIDTQTIRKTISGSPRILAYFDLDYDETGNVITRDEKIWHAGAAPVGTNPETAASPNGTGTWTYVYDGASRMLSATGPKAPPATGNGTWTYTYDGQGNRLTETAPGATTPVTTTTDAQGWPVATDNGTSANTSDDTALTYDTAGNLAKIQAPASQLTTTFTYDAWARTTRTVTSGASSSDITYAIDAFGRTSSRGPTGGAASTITNYRYAGDAETLVTEITGSTTTTYSHTPGGPLARKVGSAGAEVFIRDLHGDVVGRLGLAAGTHDMSAATWFSPWGVPSATPLEGTAARLGYQGQITETSTGAVDMTTRQYLPALGRFTTRDVLFGQPRDPLSLNQYGYGEANPVTFVDPTGLGYKEGGCDECSIGDGKEPPERIPDPDETAESTVPTGPVWGQHETYEGWIHDNERWIFEAANAYGLHPSVIAGVLATEHYLDKREMWNWEERRFLEPVGEWGAGGVCSAPLVGRLGRCQRLSIGPGQVQIRRAALVDERVKAFFGGNDPTCIDFVECSAAWPGGFSGMTTRLRDNRVNIHYVAAYLQLLQDQHPPGTDWTRIYVTRTDVGEYNNDWRFARAFTDARLYFSYLDG